MNRINTDSLNACFDKNEAGVLVVAPSHPLPLGLLMPLHSLSISRILELLIRLTIEPDGRFSKRHYTGLPTSNSMFALQTIKRILPALPLLMFLGGCTEDPVFPERTVSVTATGLPVIDGDAYYELWFSYPLARADSKGPRPDHSDAAYFSVGKFKVDGAGTPIAINGGNPLFAIPSGYNANLISDAILTVIRNGTTDTIPGARMLSGEFVGTTSRATATLKLDGRDAFGTGIIPEAGVFALDAPTGTPPADNPRGIWFVRFVLDLGRIIDTLPGLELDPLPLNPDDDNWIYQGWLKRTNLTGADEYIPLGRFTSTDSVDDNGAGPAAGPNISRAFQYPGEDFVAAGQERMLNNGSYGLIVSLEPTEIRLNRPLIVVLRRDTIESTVQIARPLSLAPPTQQPQLEVVVDR